MKRTFLRIFLVIFMILLTNDIFNSFLWEYHSCNETHCISMFPYLELSYPEHDYVAGFCQNNYSYDLCYLYARNWYSIFINNNLLCFKNLDFLENYYFIPPIIESFFHFIISLFSILVLSLAITLPIWLIRRLIHSQRLIVIEKFAIRFFIIVSSILLISSIPLFCRKIKSFELSLNKTLFKPFVDKKSHPDDLTLDEITINALASIDPKCLRYWIPYDYDDMSSRYTNANIRLPTTNDSPSINSKSLRYWKNYVKIRSIDDPLNSPTRMLVKDVKYDWNIRRFRIAVNDETEISCRTLNRVSIKGMADFGFTLQIVDFIFDEEHKYLIAFKYYEVSPTGKIKEFSQSDDIRALNPSWGVELSQIIYDILF